MLRAVDNVNGSRDVSRMDEVGSRQPGIYSRSGEVDLPARVEHTEGVKGLLRYASNGTPVERVPQKARADMFARVVHSCMLRDERETLGNVPNVPDVRRTYIREGETARRGSIVRDTVYPHE